MLRRQGFFIILILFSFSVQADRGMSGMITNQVSRTVNQGVSKNLFDNLIIPRLKVKNGSGQVKDMQLSDNMRFLSLLLEDGSARVWDLEIGVQRPMIRLPDRSIHTITSHAGSNMLYAGSGNTLIGYDFLTARSLYTLTISQSPVAHIAISSDNTQLAVLQQDNMLSLWDTATKASQWRVFVGNHDIKQLQLANKNQSLIVQTHQSSLFSSSEQIEIREMSHGNVIQTLNHQDNEVVFLGSTDSSTMIDTVYENGDLIQWDILTGQLVSQQKLADKILFADKLPNGIIAYAIDEETIVIKNSSNHVLNQINKKGLDFQSLKLLGTGDKLLTTVKDGKVILWNTVTADEIVQLISTREGWTVVDHVGRFDSSEQGMPNVSWEAAKKDIPIDSFSGNYYEPGLLATTLKAEPYLQTQPTVIQQGITLPPELEIRVTDIKSRGEFAELTVEVYGQGGGIKKVDLYHNAKFIPEQRVVKEDKVFKEGNRERRTLQMEITPVNGKNKVKVIAENNMGIEGQSDNIEFEIEKPATKPMLRLATVGINEYKDKRLNLDYSVADAQTVAGLINQKQTALKFASVNKKQLHNASATKLSILYMLNDLAKGTEEDVLAVYLAGHGISVESEWYFLPHETILQADMGYYKTVGISATELGEVFADSKVQHILLMVDACYSGASVDSFRRLQNSQRKFSRRISKTIGITVVTATRKDQEAAELADLGHGLFTYILSKGIQGEADAVPKDAQVSAHELADFSTQSIPAFSRKYLGAAQEPTAFTMGDDFYLLSVE